MNDLERTKRIKDLAEKLANLAINVQEAEDTNVGPHIALFLVKFELDTTISKELDQLCASYLVK